MHTHVKPYLTTVILVFCLTAAAAGKSPLDYPKDQICIDLMNSFKNNDIGQFILKRLPTQEQYVDTLAKNNQKRRTYYSNQYAKFLSDFKSSWARALDDSKLIGLNWEESEYLQWTGSQTKECATISFYVRENHQHFFAELGDCILVNEKWLCFDRVSISKFKERTPRIQKAEQPLLEETGLNVEIPTDGFKAVFFDVKTKDIKHEEILTEIHIDLRYANYRNAPNYKGDTFYGINARDLAVYFVGNVEFHQETEKIINIEWTHWSRARVHIDNNRVFGRRVTYLFEKGKHTIEALYLNRINPLMWAKFHIKLNDPTKDYSRREITKALSGIIEKDTEFWYAAAYESKDKLQKFTLKLSRSDAPVILFISTYEIKHFNIYNVQQSNLQAIVLSANRATTISTHGTETKVPIFHMIGLHSIPHVRKLEPEITIRQSKYSVESRVKELFAEIKEVTGGRRLHGFSAVYDAYELNVPEIVVTNEQYSEINRKIEKAWELNGKVAK